MFPSLSTSDVIGVAYVILVPVVPSLEFVLSPHTYAVPSRDTAIDVSTPADTEIIFVKYPLPVFTSTGYTGASSPPVS